MAKEVTLKLYKFSELDKKVQEKIANEWSEVSARHFDTEDMTEWLKQELVVKGYPDDLDLHWSLGGQGSGVAFYGELSSRELKALAQKVMPEEWWEEMILLFGMEDFIIKYDFVLEIRGSGSRYHHYNSMDINLDRQEIIPMPEKIQVGLQTFLKTITEHIRQTSRDLYQAAQEYWDHETGLEHAMECLMGDPDEKYLEDGREL